jgi:hypothetical protein
VTWFFVVAALLVAFGWLGYRRRIGEVRGSGLSDADIRAIEEGGRVAADDPLDLGEAAEEEERFWDETWDEPEPL